MQYAPWIYPVHWLAYGLGAGLVPAISGTLGAVAGAVVFWLVSRLKPFAYMMLTGVMFISGIYICGRTAADLGAHDPNVIVFDEIVGFLVAMYRVPRKFEWVVGGLVVFGILDAWKPWPIFLLEEIPVAGTAIMLDDVGAGLVSLAILHAVQRFVSERPSSSTRNHRG